MNKLIRNPITNAIGLAVLSGFYGLMFLGFSDAIVSQAGQSKEAFWVQWDCFLVAGGHRTLACLMLVLTAVVIVYLRIRHKPYDEYHVSILVNCLVTALVLTLAALAAFFVVIVSDSAGAIGKYAFFIALNWTVVVFSNLIYLLICAKR